jgi:integrase/recombinase XerD
MATGPMLLLSTRGGAMDFTDAWDAWRLHLLVDTDCAYSTISEYGSTLRRWNRFLEREGVTWDQIDRGHLNRFLDRPAATGRRRGESLSVNRRRTDIIAIHGLYRFALLACILDRDPLALVRLPRHRQGAPRSFVWEELGVILRAAHHDDRLHAICWLAFGAGLRRAEIATLDLADLERIPWPGGLRVVGKGSRERWVPLSAKVRRVVDRHLGDRASLTAGPLIANHTHPGQHLKPGTVGDIANDLIHGLGERPHRHGLDGEITFGAEGDAMVDHRCPFKWGSIHWLRHSHAYLALEAAHGENLEELREGMGHAESSTTRAYGHRYQWRVREKVTDVIPDPELSP